MKKIALILSLVPSVALAHPGHNDVGVGGNSTTHAFITNPVFLVALCVAVTIAATRIYLMMVRK